MVSSNVAQSAVWRLYRVGWYAGAGMRDVFHGPSFNVQQQPACPPDPKSGLIQCGWAPSFSFDVSPGWTSGLYLIQVVRDDGFGTEMPFVITDDRPSDLLFQSSVNTAQAYNDWGGSSLYVDNTGRLPWHRAVEVSFDRPYTGANGSGQMLSYELYMARFLERYGYDVSYTTNVDVSVKGAALLEQHGAFLSVGHDEYWSKAERDALEQARDAGTSELFFCGNSGLWQVRYADDPGDGNPRLMIGWKDLWMHDPDQGAEVTGKFRDPPLNRPENALEGVMSDTWSFLHFPLVVQAPDHFLFQGTGLAQGDSIPWIVGYEEDRAWNNGASPGGLVIAAREPLVSVLGQANLSESTSYRAPSGALVFGAGSIEWSWGLADGPSADPRVERMTANVLHEALGLPVPAALLQPAAPPASITGPFASTVSTLAGDLGAPTAVAVLPDGSVAATDTAHHRILRIGPAPARSVTVIAGAGSNGTDGWEAPTPGAQVRFDTPGGLVADAAGNLFVADTNNHCLRKILPDAASTVVTLAGHCGLAGFADGPSGMALFDAPLGLALLPKTGDLVVADSRNNRIRLVNTQTGLTRTLAGSAEGTTEGPARNALFDAPTAVAVDSTGRVYVVSSGSTSLARIGIDADRTVTLLTAGTPGARDGTGDLAGLGPQQGLAWDGTALLVSDAANGRIRRVFPGAHATDTQVTTWAGSGRRGLVDGAGVTAELGLPLGLALGPNGTLYVADVANGAVRMIQR